MFSTNLHVLGDIYSKGSKEVKVQALTEYGETTPGELVNNMIDSNLQSSQLKMSSFYPHVHADYTVFTIGLFRQDDLSETRCMNDVHQCCGRHMCS